MWLVLINLNACMVKEYHYNVVIFVLIANILRVVVCLFFFFQAEDGIGDIGVTGVQTCALPISGSKKYIHFFHYFLLPKDVTSGTYGTLVAGRATKTYTNHENQNSGLLLRF